MSNSALRLETAPDEESLLDVRELSTSFATERGVVEAIHGVSFNVHQGEVVGLVGESGCGKSVTANSLIRLLNDRTTVYHGLVYLNGLDLLSMSVDEMNAVRGAKVGMVFQDPMASLNPVHRIGDQIAEALRVHADRDSDRSTDKHSIHEEVVRLLAETGIPSPEERYWEYPYQLSGGMRQRVVIAIAIACKPDLLIADEPTTALDVTTQAQILDLIQTLSAKYSMGTLLITHDLGVVAQTCTRLNVMYLGQVVESGYVADVFEHPAHPYTRALLAAVPTLDKTTKLRTIEGRVPSLFNIPPGCRFAARCPYAVPECLERIPEMEMSTYCNTGVHQVRCIRHAQLEEGDDNND